VFILFCHKGAFTILLSFVMLLSQSDPTVAVKYACACDWIFVWIKMRISVAFITGVSCLAKCVNIPFVSPRRGPG